MNKTFQQLFQQFGISTLITPKEFGSLYKKLAITFHPDKGGDEIQMQRLNALKDFINSKEFSNFRVDILRNSRRGFAAGDFKNIVIFFLSKHCQAFKNFDETVKRTTILQLEKKYREIFVDISSGFSTLRKFNSSVMSTNARDQVVNILHLALEKIPNKYKFSDAEISSFLETQYDNAKNKEQFITPFHSKNWIKIHKDKVSEKTSLSAVIFLVTYNEIVQETLDKVKNYIIRSDKKLSETMFSDALSPNIIITAKNIEAYFTLQSSEVNEFLSNYELSIIENEPNKRILKSKERIVAKQRFVLSELLEIYFDKDYDTFITSAVKVRIFNVDISILFKKWFDTSITQNFVPNSSVKTNEEYFLRKLVKKYCLSKLAEYNKKNEIIKGVPSSVEDKYNDHIDRSWFNEFEKKINEGNSSLMDQYERVIPSFSKEAMEKINTAKVESNVTKAFLTYLYITHKHIKKQDAKKNQAELPISKFSQSLLNHFIIADKFEKNMD